jgi:hypothetical protein
MKLRQRSGSKKKGINHDSIKRKISSHIYIVLTKRLVICHIYLRNPFPFPREKIVDSFDE